MSELQQYYDTFRTGYWADPDPTRCPCHGNGWVLSEVDTWHECPCHPGQRHPEDDRDEDDGDTIPSPPPVEVRVLDIDNGDIPF